MKALITLVCALCAFSSSALGQASLWREFVTEWSKTQASAVDPALSEPFVVEAPFLAFAPPSRAEAAFTRWAHLDDPDKDYWLTKDLKTISRNLGRHLFVDDLIEGKKWDLGYGSELRLRLEQKKILRYQVPVRDAGILANLRHVVIRPGTRLLEKVFGGY